MDFATLGGLIGALAIIIISNLIAGGNPAQLISSPVPFLLTILGAIAASAAQYPLSVILSLPKVLGKAFLSPKEHPTQAIGVLVTMADKARREGLLSLEEEAKKLHDPFMRQGVQLAVDGVDPAQVRSIMEADIHAMHERHETGIQFFAQAGGFSPTMGIIGTVMEMIVLMQHLDDPSHVGHGIANALLVTLWGLGAANLLFLPISGKLKANSAEEVAFRRMMMEGVLSLQAGENPRVVKEKLSAFLPPKARAAEAKSAAKQKSGAGASAGAEA
jgi:chemotaxis protein MotA